MLADWSTGPIGPASDRLSRFAIHGERAGLEPEGQEMEMEMDMAEMDADAVARYFSMHAVCM